MELNPNRLSSFADRLFSFNGLVLGSHVGCRPSNTVHIGRGANNQSQSESGALGGNKVPGKIGGLPSICIYVEPAVHRNMNLRSIQRGILALRGGSQPAASQWAATVGRIIQELENLNRSTERDFLAVGEKLRTFRGTARQIQSDMAAVTELISGDQGRQASHALSGMLEHSHAIDARIEQREQALTRVRELSLGLRRAFSGLSNLVAVFRSLCTLTRIETSRWAAPAPTWAIWRLKSGPYRRAFKPAGRACSSLRAIWSKRSDPPCAAAPSCVPRSSGKCRP